MKLTPLARLIVTTVLEVVAVALIAVLVAAVAAPIWALIPIALYLLLAAASITVRDRGDA